MKKYDIVKKAKLINIIAAGFLATAGMVLLIFPDMIDWGVKIMIGCLCVLVGAAKLLGYFSNDLYRLAFQFDFAMGILVVILGVLTIVGGTNTVELLPTAFGIYIILDGALKLQTAFDAKRFGVGGWVGIFCSALVLCLCGGFTVYTSYAHLLSPVRILGASLVIDADINIWITAYTVRVRTKKKSLKDLEKQEAENEKGNN